MEKFTFSKVPLRNGSGTAFSNKDSRPFLESLEGFLFNFYDDYYQGVHPFAWSYIQHHPSRFYPTALVYESIRMRSKVYVITFSCELETS